MRRGTKAALQHSDALHLRCDSAAAVRRWSFCFCFIFPFFVSFQRMNAVVKKAAAASASPSAAGDTGGGGVAMLSSSL